MGLVLRKRQSRDRRSFSCSAEASAKLIAKNPEIGIRTLTRRPDLQGLRRFPIKDGFEEILMFYFPRYQGIEMVRVVRGTRNIAALLNEGQIR